ncbi:MAG TPA: N-acetyltransferase family protein [Methanofastidiosum sp.]|nr:N-acetyltransferase family protein [Methanofastidiosum sp.]HPA48894.1 N-acetyltransferase family protein [Methanofastidiosum sp.]HQK63144.1 N-acetyltransferase family protein [Methanofastidiosum sp.]HQM94198.1 N-acetyltransferase family protein [Methanofastidiosum sp.]HQQ49249.1 N-acetyltransferase family protein [Methanofastidiosum sp.]
MEIHFEPMGENHRTDVIDIFNHYIENGFAAYPDNKLPYEFYDMFLIITKGYPAVVIKSDKNEVIGFGFIHSYSPFSVFKETAEISYFIKEESTGQGIGKKTLDYIESEAKKLNISSILASISSINEGSINFHKKNGFVECGRFVKIGKKFDRYFDVVWMQKML